MEAPRAQGSECGQITLKNLVLVVKISCCGNVWLQEIPTTPNFRKLQRHKSFDQVIYGVSDEFEQSDKEYMTPFKEKYVEVYGSSTKNWEKVFRRVRGRGRFESIKRRRRARKVPCSLTKYD